MQAASRSPPPHRLRAAKARSVSQMTLKRQSSDGDDDRALETSVEMNHGLWQPRPVAGTRTQRAMRWNDTNAATDSGTDEDVELNVFDAPKVKPTDSKGVKLGRKPEAVVGSLARDCRVSVEPTVAGSCDGADNNGAEVVGEIYVM